MERNRPIHRAMDLRPHEQVVPWRMICKTWLQSPPPYRMARQTMHGRMVIYPCMPLAFCTQHGSTVHSFISWMQMPPHWLQRMWSPCKMVKRVSNAMPVLQEPLYPQRPRPKLHPRRKHSRSRYPAAQWRRSFRTTKRFPLRTGYWLQILRVCMIPIPHCQEKEILLPMTIRPRHWPLCLFLHCARRLCPWSRIMIATHRSHTIYSLRLDCKIRVANPPIPWAVAVMWPCLSRSIIRTHFLAMVSTMDPGRVHGTIPTFWKPKLCRPCVPCVRELAIVAQVNLQLQLHLHLRAPCPLTRVVRS